MQRNEFQTQIDRLKSAFNPSFYNDERTKLIWEEVKFLSNECFTKIVDTFIGSYRQAPLVPDFLSIMEQTRAAAYEKKKEQIKQDSKDFWAGTYHPEEVKQIIGTIKRRINGECPDDEWAAHMDSLKQAERQSKPTGCYYCDNSGILVAMSKANNTPYGFRCTFCSSQSGHNISRQMPFWNDHLLSQYSLF